MIDQLSEKAQYHRNMAQVHAIQYQVEAGIITHAIEYIRNGTGELFAMIMDGGVTLDVDWLETKRKAMDLLNITL